MRRYRNVLLVYPQVPQTTYWSFSHTMGFIGKKSAMPPLGLLTLAALFPSNCNLRLVDMNVTDLDPILVKWADAVFVSAMIVQRASFNQVVALCNEIGRPVVAGGPYATSNHPRIEGVDHFILGEAEEIFAVFWKDFENGTAQRVYRCSRRPDLARSVMPRFDLLQLDAYANMAVQYSRGCPFRCEFCDIWTVFGNHSRVKPAGRFIAEIEQLYRLGWRGSVFVVDDNFIGNRQRVKEELLPALIRWQADHDGVFQLFTEASIDLADDRQLLEAMCQAGFNEVFVGIETPSAEGLQETGKLQNLATDLSQAVAIIQRHGMEVTAGFIIGFDSDDPSIFDRQIAFIQQAAIPKAMIGLLTALPGTRLWARLRSQGRLLKESGGNNTHQAETNFITRLPREILKTGYLRVLATLYGGSLHNYFARCSRLLDRIQERDHFQRSLQMKHLVIVARSLLYQTISPYGLHYLGFLGRNLLKNRDLFGEAVRLAIQGHHFYTITRQALAAERIRTRLEERYQELCRQLKPLLQRALANSRGTWDPVARFWRISRSSFADIRRRADQLPADMAAEIRQRCEEVSAALLEKMARHEKDGYNLEVDLRQT
jgi:radical SAM superfamily enzyme YgiQ (UPF0313 family)